MEHYMGDEKIEQNVGRLKEFLFHTLGCGKEDTRRIFTQFAEKHLDGRLQHDGEKLEEWRERLREERINRG